ncbi:LacI family transcriptional regulator [Orenia metallireducens]|jgi:LacI family transcriptional regulator|uniref:Transcriptional regulator, LacI family n=1 Tax=Orenia metallireducens TaxID=1413210 RepID=A0A285G828_9FIRM|nr:LacI family DNA-binding transcriptional regulator [Orenia metallireducens]PRX28289.1 LacI family transcriptional regulator [Orenia metallireducens]SNY19493.1 transcriptional regulator, LacI family [Orenia metallireducens]
MEKSEITIKDVAKLAGCSPTTVSRVINNSDHPVSSKTKALVKEAIKELNFRPNRIAQGLKSDKSHIIGVIVHDICDSYFAQMVKGIEEFISDYDYIINIYNTNRGIEKELHSVNMLKVNRADAVVFAGSTLLDEEYRKIMGEYVQNLKKQGTVIVGVTPHPFEIVNIELGNELAAQTITDYVLNKGHRKIAYVAGPKILNTSQQRSEGFKKALKCRGIEVDNRLIIRSDFSFEGGRKAALELLDNIDEVTAVVAANDATALGLMWELNNQGIKVPQDVSVVGVDDLPEAKYSYPPLTTISLPVYKLGKQIGEYLINKLHGNKIVDDPANVQISLIERGSVRDLL